MQQLLITDVKPGSSIGCPTRLLPARNQACAEKGRPVKLVDAHLSDDQARAVVTIQVGRMRRVFVTTAACEVDVFDAISEVQARNDEIAARFAAIRAAR